MSIVTDRQATSHRGVNRLTTRSRSTERQGVVDQDAANQDTVRQDTARQSTAREGVERQGTAESDGLAIASFLLGLPGLLLFNIALGPIAITLATLALVRGTSRRGRAILGLTLGVASLAILAVTTATSRGVIIDIGS